MAQSFRSNNDRPTRSNHRQFIQVDIPVDERERLDRAVIELSGCVALQRQHPQITSILEQLKRLNANSKMSAAFSPRPNS